MRQLLKKENFNSSVEDIVKRWGENVHVSDTIYPRPWPRTQVFKSGGPNNSPFIRLTAFAGDYLLWNNNQRNEIGRNERFQGAEGGAGTFFLYEDGTETITEFWSRLQPNWPYDSWYWGGFMQMKQTQSYETSIWDTGVAGGLSMEGKQFMVDIMWKEHIALHNPPPNKWFKHSYHVRHSVGNDGFWKIKFDGVKYPKSSLRPTLIRDADGKPVPSHLRLGPYVPNESPTLYVDIAKVRIYKV